MADEVDSKSSGSDTVRVQVPPPAPNFKTAALSRSLRNGSVLRFSFAFKKLYFSKFEHILSYLKTKYDLCCYIFATTAEEFVTVPATPLTATEIVLSPPFFDIILHLLILKNCSNYALKMLLKCSGVSLERLFGNLTTP